MHRKSFLRPFLNIILVGSKTHAAYIIIAAVASGFVQPDFLGKWSLSGLFQLDFLGGGLSNDEEADVVDDSPIFSLPVSATDVEADRVFFFCFA